MWSRPRGTARRMYAEAKASRIPGLAAMCAASFLAVADTTIVAIALPSLREDLGFTAAGVAWVLNAYSLTFGGLLLLCGRLGDLVGRLWLFRIGLLVFAVASLGAALAWAPAALVVARFAQGVGAAAFVPASLALLNAAAADDGVRSRAVGWYGAAASLGFVVGMLGGGVVTELSGWRWVFVAVLVIASCLLLASLRLTDPRTERSSRGLDVTGAILVTAGLALLVQALSSMGQGLGPVWVLLAGAAGTLSLLAFVVVERRTPEPLIPRSLVINRVWVAPNVAVAFQSLVGISWLFLLTTYFQDVRHQRPIEAGLSFTPMTLAGLASALLAGRLVARLGARTGALRGMTIVAAGIVLLAWGTSVDHVSAVVVGSIVGEAGFLLSNVGLTVAATEDPGSADEGALAGVLNTAIQLGTALGLGVVATVVAVVLPHGERPAITAGLIVCLTASLLALLAITRLARAARL